MCAYNPGIAYDPSPLGQGLAQGLGGLAEGLLANARKREEKERWAKTLQVLGPVVEQQSQGRIKLDKDTPKEAMPALMQIAEQVEREQREAPLRSLQIENEKLRQRISQQELDSASAHAAALQEAAPALQAGDARAAFATYTAKGGRDPRTLAELGALAQQQEKNLGRPKPGLVNFGLDAHGRPVEGLVDAQGNVSRIPHPDGGDPAAKPFTIGGKQFHRIGSTIMDDTGAIVKAGPAEKPIDPLQEQMLLRQYQTALEESEGTGSGWLERDSTAEKRRANARQRANQLAARLGYQPPFPDGAAAPPPSAPATKPAAAAPAGPAKGYEVKDGQIRFAPGADLLASVQAALDDGAIDEPTARRFLEQNGYKRKAAK